LRMPQPDPQGPGGTCALRRLKGWSRRPLALGGPVPRAQRACR
jgi:hypothetical protein